MGLKFVWFRISGEGNEIKLGFDSMRPKRGNVVNSIQLCARVKEKRGGIYLTRLGFA